MRHSSIDVLRTIAIIVMVVVHFLENLSGVREWSPEGFGAPLFTFLTGMSYRLWLSGQEAKQKEPSGISKITIRRGLFLFGLGFVFNTFVWLPDDLFTWDVLTFIGASMIVLNVVRGFRIPLMLLTIFITIGISPVLQHIANYDAYWANGYFDYEHTLSDVLLGFLVTGYFPMFPWIAFPITGFMAGSVIFDRKVRQEIVLKRTLFIGLALGALAGATVVFGKLFPASSIAGLLPSWTMYPASTVYAIGTLGMTLTLFVIFHRWIDLSRKFDRSQGVLAVAGTFSRHSLSVYLLHHVVHIWPLWIYGMSVAREPSRYWGNALPWTISLPLAGAFLILCYFVLRFMQKHETPTIESLMRWLCD